MPNLRPRLCAMEKGADGYGFHLHGEKTKSGQFVRLVEPDTPASAAGLLAGDRLMFVNGDSVEGESHQQVVAKIRATVGRLELIVVDADTAELLQKHNLKCQKEFVTEGIPVPGDDSDSDRGDSHSNGSSRRGSSPGPRENGDASSDRLSVSSKVKRKWWRCLARVSAKARQWWWGVRGSNIVFIKYLFTIIKLKTHRHHYILLSYFRTSLLSKLTLVVDFETKTTSTTGQFFKKPITF